MYFLPYLLRGFIVLDFFLYLNVQVGGNVYVVRKPGVSWNDSNSENTPVLVSKLVSQVCI